MLNAVGGLEGRERPVRGLQRNNATKRSVVERHRGDSPVEILRFTRPCGLVKCST